MNKEKHDELVERAQKYIGLEILVGSNKDNSIPHIFTSINTLQTKIQNESTKYDPMAILMTPDKKQTPEPLKKVVEYFEAKTKN